MLQKIRYNVTTELNVFHPRMMLARFLMSAIPPYVGGGIRSAIMRMVGFHIGSRTRIWGKPFVVGGGDIYHKLSIGEDCYVGIDIYFDMAGSITIGNRVGLGPQIMFITGSHTVMGSYKRTGQLIPKSITVRDGAWIGARALILPGITIGEGAVIGAGAVVTRNVRPNTLVAGSPASLRRNLSLDDPTPQDK
jgi:maltose O-acetyltransferase